MEQYYQIIILSNTFKTTKSDILVIDKSIILEDDVHLTYNNQVYSFDYLIFTDVNQISNFRKTNILHEDNLPITNFYHQTTYENIYYTNNIENVIDIIFEINL